MDIERGMYGSLPYAAVGSGSPLVVFAGLMPVTGVAGDATVRSIVHPLLPLTASRRLVVLNRRAGMPRGMTMAELASEHADALRDAFDGPVDLVGSSTRGSIAVGTRTPRAPHVWRAHFLPAIVMPHSVRPGPAEPIPRLSIAAGQPNPGGPARH